MGDVLEVDRISKRYGSVVALDGASFALRRGEVLALAGHNGAGKSTLAGILAGARRPDSGTIKVDGKVCTFGGVNDARAVGIGMVYQEPKLVPDLSVIANVYLGFERNDALLRLDSTDLRTRFRQAVERTNIRVPPDAKVSSLSVAQQQLIQILRAVATGAKIIILDEPTSALSSVDRERLFDLIRGMRSGPEPHSFIFVSHFLKELEANCDRAIVMREGRVVATTSGPPDARYLAEVMTGSKGPGSAQVRTAQTHGAELLRLRQSEVDDLTVSAGEIVGLAGLVGSGRSRLLRTIASAQLAAGSISVEGKDVSAFRGRLRPGLALLPEDRRSALIADWPLWKNVTLPSLGGHSPFARLDTRAEREQASSLLDRCRIVASGVDAPVRTLSGGNQQKVAFARLLASGFKIGLLDEPTHGVDVHAKSDIFGLIDSLAAEGLGFVVVSAEFDDLLALCTRIVTIHKGLLVASHDNHQGASIAIEDLLYEAATGLPSHKTPHGILSADEHPRHI